MDEDDLAAVERRCRNELGVDRRDLDMSGGVTSQARDLVAAVAKVGSDRRLCIRGVAEGEIHDATYSLPTYAIDGLTTERLVMLRTDHTYLVAGSFLNSSVRLTAQSPIDSAGGSTHQFGDDMFLAWVSEPELQDDDTGIVIDIWSGPASGISESETLELGPGPWRDIGSVGS